MKQKKNYQSPVACVITIQTQHLLTESEQTHRKPSADFMEDPDFDEEEEEEAGY